MPGAGDAIASSERLIPLSILDSRVLDIVCGSNIEEIHIAVSQYRLAHGESSALEVPNDATSLVSQITQGNLFAFEQPRETLCTRERVLKRAADIVISSFGLLVLSPLMLFVSVIIRLDSPGPILFRQIRKGLNGQPFHILKFRTMFVMEDGEVVTQAIRNDTRVTRVGRWLRRASVDELPQLVNVLRGDMSFVGPRPHALAHDNEYEDLITNYARRHHVKPGITGWAQVKGFRGETAELTLMQRRVELDLWYIANWSLALDFWILIRTCFELLRARNAF